MCRGAINRAKWLLCIPPYDEKEEAAAAAGSSSQHHNPPARRARSRSRGCVSADLTSTWVVPGAHHPHHDHDPAHLLTSAAQELKQLLEFRRAAVERRKREKTTSEVLLSFLQSDTMVEDLQRLMRARERQAASRAQALGLARSLLASLRTDDSRVEVLRAAVRGIRLLSATCKVRGP